MTSVPKTMRAMVLTGYGGLDKLEYRTDITTPVPQSGEVLIKVGACGLNNTDINTRAGWYSKSVTEGTTSSGGREGFSAAAADTATWTAGGITFPHVQGADAVGRIVAVGSGVSDECVGARVMVDGWLRDPACPAALEKARYFGSECWGGYADYTVVPVGNAFPISTSLSDAELATFPCSYSTAENMLLRVGLRESDVILVTGASGGVGSALIQLAKLRGAWVIAVAGAAKEDPVRGLGADAFVARDDPDWSTALVGQLAGRALDVAADVVGGAGFKDLLTLLRQGGRYVTAGAIAGPIVELDLRTLYLQDLTLYGATVNDSAVFPSLVSHIESGQIRPLLAETYPLQELRLAQEAFMRKQHVGNIVVTM